MAQTSSQSTVNKIEMRLRGKGRGSIVFQRMNINELGEDLEQLFGKSRNINDTYRFCC